MSPRMEIAKEAWGEVPDWIAALVTACDARNSSQNKVALRLGFSGSVVSSVLRKDYRGAMDRVEARVRAIFIPGTVNCPALGPIGTEGCLAWQDRSVELTSASPNVVRMFIACRDCPLNRKPEDEA